jgi:hypothetical protein
MATYIQGQNDYISQIQPTEPNLAFDAQILATKQSKYDANHKKISDLYGSLLNSSMTRTDNIQARDEFFKIINNDIKRMGSMDFSLDQNVQAASGVFQSIYTNNNIVKDMVWTKNFNSELDRSDAFKNCRDADKCGGQWWEEGDKYLQYKKLEYKNASAGDALGMEDPSFVPYINVMDKAIKLAKEAGLSIKKDSFSADGQYIVTTKNGVLLSSPLTQLFNQTLAKDPAYQKMFKVKAYTERKDWLYSKVQQGEYADENEASVGYFKQKNDLIQANLKKAAGDLSTDVGSLTEKFNSLNDQYKAGKIKPGSDDYKVLESLPELIAGATDAKNYTDMMIKASDNANNPKGLQSLGDISDDQAAAAYFNEAIEDAAFTLANKDSEMTLTADEFAKKKADFMYDSKLLSQKHSQDIALERQKAADRMALAEFEAQNNVTDENTLDNSADFQTKRDAALAMDPRKVAYDLYIAQNPDETVDYANFDASSLDGTLKASWDQSVNAANIKVTDAKRDANNAALKFGESLPFTEVLTINDLGTSDIDDAQGQQLIDELLTKKPSTVTKADFDAAVLKVDKTKPIETQLIKAGVIMSDEQKRIMDGLSWLPQ